MDLYSSFRSYDEEVKKNNPAYSGLLGLTIDGEQRVSHPTRNGFVYFRFRDNLSETALAFNDKVSPVYDLPVQVERRNNYWYVIGRDVARYSNWGSSAPFLPQHGFQHSFNRDDGTGGDVVFVYPDQFVPLLVYPSGTDGSGNLLVAPYVLQRTSDFIYVGNTGTRNLLTYKPTGTSAIMGLVYLDRQTGNPGVLINSGTSLGESVTGTAGIAPFIPFPSSTQEPLYAFRLVSGTQSLQWGNLYNARQFIGGSTSSGSSIGTLTAQRVVITDSGGTVTTDDDLYYDDSNNIMIVGDSSISPTLSPNSFQMVNDGVSPAVILASYGSGTAPFVTGFKTDGSAASPTNVKDEQVLFRVRARGHDGVDFTNTQGEIRYVAEGDWDAGSHPIKIEYYATATGSTTLQLIAGMHGDKSFWMANSVSGTVARPDSGSTAIGTDTLTKRLYSIDDEGNRSDYLVSGTPTLTVQELDGSPSVSNVRRILTDRITVTDLGAGFAMLSSPAIAVQDEGVSKGTVSTLNFVGDNVDASVSGSVARIFVTGTPGTSLLNGSSVLASTINLTGSAAAYQEITGISLTLPSAGTYKVTADVRAAVDGNSGSFWWIVAKLQNATTSTFIPNSERIIVFTNSASFQFQNTASINKIITVTGSHVIKLYAARDGIGPPTYDLSTIGSDTNGYTEMMYEKIG